VSTYEDLWRFTLASYNAGPGCVADALRFTWRQDEPLDWEHVAARLPDGCKGAVGYVEAVSSNKD
jgi:membrane-bound lytic murein transglycosylase MltF